MSDAAAKGWQGAAVAAALGVAGMSIDLVIGHGIPGMPWWPNLLSATLSAVVLALLLAGQRSLRFTATSFALNNLVIVGALWITDNHYAAATATWVPFRPHQLSILTAALLAPPALWSGILSVALFSGSAVLQFFAFDPDIRARLPASEPWVMFVYGLFGGALVIYRAQHFASERARARAETEAAALQRLARTFLAVRDLANTPLQTIALNAVLLRRQHPELIIIIERIERALTRLQEGTRLLACYDSHLRWDASDESFDPVAVLRRDADE